MFNETLSTSWIQASRCVRQETQRDLESAYEPIRGSDHHLVSQIEATLRVSSQIKPKSNPPIPLGDSDAPTIVSAVPDETRPMLEPPTQGVVGRVPTPAPIAAEPGPNWRTPALAAAAIAVVLLAALFVRRDASRTGVTVNQPVPAVPSAQVPAATPVVRRR